jgi:hypothetical protein
METTTLFALHKASTDTSIPIVPALAFHLHRCRYPLFNLVDRLNFSRANLAFSGKQQLSLFLLSRSFIKRDSRFGISSKCRAKFSLFSPSRALMLRKRATLYSAAPPSPNGTISPTERRTANSRRRRMHYSRDEKKSVSFPVGSRYSLRLFKRLLG